MQNTPRLLRRNPKSLLQITKLLLLSMALYQSALKERLCPEVLSHWIFLSSAN